jgi:hypothetical protein
MAAHHTSAPLVPAEFADFCGSMMERYSDHIQAPHRATNQLAEAPTMS